MLGERCDAQIRGHVLNHSAKDIVIDSLKKLYRYRKRQKLGGLSNHFPLYLLEHLNEYDEVLGLFEDDLSRQLIAWFIQFRLVNSLVLDKDKTRDIVDPLLSRNDSALLNLEAARHPAGALAASISVDVIENWLLEGYRLPGLCEAQPGDYVLDIGAFNGNSSLYFAGQVGLGGRVIAIEPDPNSADALRSNVAGFPGEHAPIEVLNLAVSDHEGELRFSKHGAASRIDPKGDISVKSRTIDALIKDLAPDHLDLMKFDIEGHEKQALAGAESTIKAYRPKLMVCIYHLAADLVEIPRLIRDISPWYKFYVRHHAAHDGELVLYCSPIRHHALDD